MDLNETILPDPNAAEHEKRRKDSLKAAITSAINKWSAENGSNTPDFILANYLIDCLRAFDLATQQRSHWYNLSKKDG